MGRRGHSLIKVDLPKGPKVEKNRKEGKEREQEREELRVDGKRALNRDDYARKGEGKTSGRLPLALSQKGSAQK